MSKIYSKVANEMFSKLWFSGFKQFVKELWRVLERRILCFGLYKNYKLKVKPWSVRAR